MKQRKYKGLFSFVPALGCETTHYYGWKERMVIDPVRENIHTSASVKQWQCLEGLL